MTNIDQSIPCDLIMGFSLDMLIDLINYASGKITIDNSHINTISPSYKYAFKNYFQTKDDKVIVHLPHGIKVIDDQQLQTIAWGVATLNGGTKSYILELSHHYITKHILTDSSKNIITIKLDYDGTGICVIDGGKLEPIPTRIIRQAIQTTIKQNPSPQIFFEPPNIDIPFADVAVDLQRLTINGHNKTSIEDQLYFEVAIDDQKYMLGSFEACGNTSIDLNLIYLLKKNNNPLRISVKGINLEDQNFSTNFLGSATTIHNTYDQTQLPNSLIGKSPETEWDLYQDLIDASIKHSYNKAQTIINPILASFGRGLKTCEEVRSTISNKIYEPLLPLKQNYILEYAVRPLGQIDISVKFLGLSLNPDTNSLCLKFNYIISGTSENSSLATNGPGFVYPDGPGMIISEGLLKKIFQTYWNYSYVLPKTFSSDYDKLLTSKSDDTNYVYSLNINSAELSIGSAKIQMAATIKAISNVEKGSGILKRTNINNSGKQSINTTSLSKLKKVLTKTDLNVSDNNKLNIILGKIEFDIDSGQRTAPENLPDTLYNSLTNILSGTKVNLLNLPKEFTFGEHSFKLSYNYTSVNPNEIIIASKIIGLKKSAFSQKPTIPPLKKDVNTISLVPKDKWGFDGTANGHFNVPCGLAIIKTEKGPYVYVVDRENNRVQKFDISGKFALKWGIKGSNDGQFDYPTDLSADNAGNVYVVDAGNDRVQKFDQDGHFITKFGSKGKGSGQFSFPQGIAMDDAGCIYVTDTNHLVQKFRSNCKFVKQWGGKGDKNGKFHSPRGIALDKKGVIYVVDAGNHRIQKFNSRGKFILKWGSKGTNDGQFCFPQGLALDSEENVYITDTGNNRIQKFDSKGKYITKVSSEGSSVGQFLAPVGIAVDKNSDIYITDSLNNRIQKFGF